MGVLFESIIGVLLAAGQVPKQLSQVGATTPPEAKATVAESSPQTGEARVAPKWQAYLAERLKKEGYHEAWGFFSYGGWSDAGQVMIFAKESSGEEKLLVVAKPNSQDVAFERKLSLQDFAQIRDQLAKINGLKDVDIQMFDGQVFEMVYAKIGSTKSDADPTFHRVYYKNPGTRQKFADHDALLDLMQKLREKQK
jgi:hypothetical protein